MGGTKPNRHLLTVDKTIFKPDPKSNWDLVIIYRTDVVADWGGDEFCNNYLSDRHSQMPT